MSRVIIGKIPKSWYAIGFSKDLLPETVRAIEIADKSLVLFRTRTNKVCVFDAFCPHLGAHLGIGGTIRGNKIRCPYHGIIYDDKGNCLNKNYSINPLNTWSVVEKYGVIFLYYGEENPSWTLPDFTFADENWTKPKTFAWKNLTIHPQNLLENGVDANHFGPIHNRPGATIKDDILFDGPKLSGTIVGKSKGGLLPGQHIWVDYKIDFSIIGLGCYLTEALIPTIGLKARMMFLPMPININNMTFYTQTTVYKQLDNFKHALLYKMIPKHLLFKIIAKKIHNDVIRSVEEDIPIWNHRSHIPIPPLAENEKEIAKFREWTKQFY